MEELIQRLDRWLRENRSDYYSQLSDGVSVADFATFEAALGVALPAEFRLFYYWKNGQHRGNQWANFILNYEIMALENIVSDYTVIKEIFDAGEFEKENWWSENWIPFMGNGAGDYICIDMGGSFGGEKGQIIQYYHDWEARTISHKDFYKWLETVIIAMEQDFLPLEDSADARYHIDFEKYQEFLKKNNTGYPKEYEAG